MQLPIDHFTWCLLRIMVRAKGKPVLGRDLRHWPSRSSKDGTFLDDLVTAGLIFATKEEPVPPKAPRIEERLQFRRRYLLTEKGLYAAEYGHAEFTRAERGLPELAKKTYA